MPRKGEGEGERKNAKIKEGMRNIFLYSEVYIMYVTPLSFVEGRNTLKNVAIPLRGQARLRTVACAICRYVSLKNCSFFLLQNVTIASRIWRRHGHRVC